MAIYSYVDTQGKLKTIEASSPQEAIKKAPGIASNSGVSLSNGSGTGATPQSGTRNLQLSSGNSAASLMQTGAASANVAQTVDPYTSFNNQLMSMLQRQQQMGTRRFQEQGFNAQAEQNKRISQKTPNDLIGANPGLQNSVRSASAGAVQPTINQANQATQTFSEQIGGFRDAIGSAKELLATYQAQEQQKKKDAIALIEGALSQGSDALNDLSPEDLKALEKAAGVPAGYVSGITKVIKAREQALAVKSAGTGGGAGTTGTTTSTASAEQIGILNDISNVLADPAFEQTFGVGNLINRNNPGSPAYGVRTTMDQVINQLSLAARGQLKGQGAVSNYEGELLRKAQTALTYYLTPDQARKELKQVAGAIRTSSGLTANVRITAPDGTSQTGQANQASITQAVMDGNRVEYI